MAEGTLYGGVYLMLHKHVYVQYMVDLQSLNNNSNNKKDNITWSKTEKEQIRRRSIGKVCEHE
jgi:hypothetical protein